MTWLLDGNILIAMMLSSHPHHERVRRWRMATAADGIATCAITEGTLLRLHMRFALDNSAEAAWDAMTSVHSHPQHVAWMESFSYAKIDPTRLTGPGQVTGAWLAALARRKGGKVATMDKAFAVLWPDTVVLIPV